MKWFKRKKKAELPEPEPIVVKSPCEMFGHLWQDFPWILEDEYEEGSPKGYYNSFIEIYEYYCCRICHNIKKELLWKSYDTLTREQHEEKKKKILEEFKDKLQPIPVVKDMLNDMINVDREKLEIWENIHLTRSCDKQ